MGMPAYNFGVQTFGKYGWYQVMGHLEKCAFETMNVYYSLLGLIKVI